MVDFVYGRKPLKIREMAFAPSSEINYLSENAVDAVYLHSLDHESMLPKRASNVVHMQYTLVNDLAKDESEILQSIKKNCRYEIRRSAREGIIAKFYCKDDLKNENTIKKVLNDFQSTYNSMFAAKKMSNRFNMNLIKAGIESGQVVVSMAVDPTDDSLKVYHAYFADGKNSILVYSASPLWVNGEKEKENKIGRMNKYLHWEDIKFFKAMGCERYEWGGINDPEKINGIGKFKMEFGGSVDLFCNYIVGRSFLGKLYCYVINMRNKKNVANKK